MTALRPLAQWLDALERGDVPRNFGRAELHDRRATLLQACRTFHHAFGEAEVVVARAPGRINLRGMHVDTHGGYLNLMTHQREVVVVAARAQEDQSLFANADPAHRPLQLRSRAPVGEWGRYVAGALAAFESRLGRPIGLKAAVASALPEGAALSSSAALCVALIRAFAELEQLHLSPDELILLAREAEWKAGARTGTSDQAAIVLGAEDTLVNVALLAQDFSTKSAKYLTFPSELCVLVVESSTTRNLSGDALLAYTRNRFAYSAALTVLREEAAHWGNANPRLHAFDRLSNMKPQDFGSLHFLYSLLARVPERIELNALVERYGFTDALQCYEEQFAAVPESKRPRDFALRAPLVFALSESWRACLFPGLVENGNFERAGRLMSVGHDGDRVCRHGRSWSPSFDDHVLAELARDETPLELVSGYYGASSPVLDAIVDAALGAGAFGASLTGAGIAGSVLVLCPAGERENIQTKLAAFLASPAYAALLQQNGGEPRCMTPEHAAACVRVNVAVPGAGIVSLD